ncbi:RICIN domain-containing protein [Streptomyces griseocarneus]|uniref:RICIN domain-containing protein n=1 Tax=Streptomyces griseocarneus TaxID=51201 RepID=UPI00167CAE2F|nr:ricin-type beta-trefoil lectin domain protein [Streptomyces griseocarneus]MBZ6475261.1 RICIN domain-containing protein [Streptomyces griseocarneus]GHG61373.1 hypothetical protein GCM10018779_29160 [Streptomyces griseocarneus]
MPGIRKIALGVAATGLLAGPLALTATEAAAAPSMAPITTSIQVYSDDTNLDEYYGTDVLTRDSRHSWQEWQLTQLDDGSYTIRGKHFGKCIAATGRGQKVTQSPCNSGNLAQRWIVDTTADTTLIESKKFKGEVIQAHGLDRAVTLEAKGSGRAAQQWGLYRK